MAGAGLFWSVRDSPGQTQRILRLRQLVISGHARQGHKKSMVLSPPPTNMVGSPPAVKHVLTAKGFVSMDPFTPQTPKRLIYFYFGMKA